MKDDPKYRLGDVVKIVNYGHLIWAWEDAIGDAPISFKEYSRDEPEEEGGRTLIWFDIAPQVVGEKAIIGEIDKGRYRLQFMPNGNKSAWFTEIQMEPSNLGTL